MFPTRDSLGRGEEPRIGIHSVDEEHSEIVALIDRLVYLSKDPSVGRASRVHELLEHLVAQARQHFVTEDRLMRQAGCDAAHVRRHAGEHAEFLRQVAVIDASRGFDMPEGLLALHEYLRSWFAFHVRECDVSMARQIEAIRNGTCPSAACAQFDGGIETGPAQMLLDSLGNMVSLVISRNLALADAEDGLRNANRLLEKRVAERTAALEVRNQALRRSLGQLKEAQNQLMQSERLASIGQLAAGVAHEINNPVGFVHSNLGTLTQYIDTLLTLLGSYVQAEALLPEEKRTELAELRDQSELDYLRGDIVDLVRESCEGLSRVTAIIKDLKTFAHADSGEWVEADLLDGLKSTLNVLSNELRYKADVRQQLSPLPLVACMPGQINQVLMNLLVNAAQAIPRRGTITLRSGVEGQEVWIEVEDDGDGMAPEVQRRIFDPFFTTKPVGKGTGLGLPMAYGIARKHGGRIEVDSRKGVGTRMRLYLPVMPPGVVQAKDRSDRSSLS